MRHHPTAFTLVELLVVIAIIVVLLALLAPAMDRAIYQAELAVCAANLRGIATGATVYASESKRYYPHREGVRDDIVWPTAQIYNGSPIVQGVYNGLWASEGATNFEVYDDRQVLRQFISLKTLSDPLTGEVDFEDVNADAVAYSTVNLWFGYGFKGHQAMTRLGDRFGWSEVDTVTNKPVNWRFDVLASDRDTITTNNGANVQSTHPDSEGRANNAVFQNGNFGFGAKWVISTWRSNTGRSTVDLNFAYADGSVRPYRGVPWNDLEMARVPELQLGPPNTYRATMPPQR